ncbi:MAG: undecaprenyl-phosphate glucose phosphotransferase [Rikenellaceae bacterium]
MERHNESYFIVATVVIGDLLVLNAVLYLFSILFQISSDWDLAQHCVIASLCYLVNISFFGGVKLHRRRVRTDQIVTTVIGNVVGFFILWLAGLSISNIEVRFTMHLMLLVFVLFVALISYRLVYQSIIKHIRKSGKQICRVLYVGSSDNMLELYEEMELSSTTGYKVLGYFDDKPNPDFPATYLGQCSEVNSYLGKSDVQRLYCSLPSANKDTIRSIMTYCESHLVRFYSVPNLRNYLKRRVTLEMFSNTPILSIRTEPLSNLDNRILKRTFDIIFSFIFMVTLFPVVLLIFGTIIKLSSPGPIFFKQKRHGLDGREFWCYKFRSMRVNVDADTLQASEHDPRKTRVGDLMRKTNIDELPQFFNVFMGDMSVVGPRPHMLKHTEEYSQLINTYMVRHLVKPGVTGWAQVTGFRGETKELSEMEGRVKADIWYMEHWTFMLDMYIIYKTVANVISRKDTKAF